MRALLSTILVLAVLPVATGIAAEPGEAARTAPAEAAPPVPASLVVPPQALVEKLGYGDRLFLAGDRRSALFAYLDAVYMESRYAPARVKLGRAYLALRYPALAVAQAEAALAVDPENADAARLLAEAKAGERAAEARPAAATASAARAAAPAAVPDPPPPSGTRRVFRMQPEPDGRSAAHQMSEGTAGPSTSAGGRVPAAATSPSR
jgi:hypothetical protein